MFGILVSCKLKEFNVAAKVCKDVISLGVSEAEFKIRNPLETPGNAMFAWEL